MVSSDCTFRFFFFFQITVMPQPASLDTGFGHVPQRTSEVGHNWQLLISLSVFTVCVAEHIGLL